MNQVMSELNISDSSLAEKGEEEPDMSGIIALAGAIPGMGALATPIANLNSIPPEQRGDFQRICAAGGIEHAI
jgi:hypothetical protein